MMEIFSEYSQNCGNAKHKAVLILKMHTAATISSHYNGSGRLSVV